MGIADYAGRTYDVLAYQGGRSQGEVLLSQQLVSAADGGQIATGVQKVAQRFLLKLLTDKGSIPHFPDEGTDFITQVRSGGLQTSLDVLAAFSEAMYDIQLQFIDEQEEDDPEDEQFESAEVISVDLTGDKATIYVRVNVVSGESTTFIAPIAAVA